jgi:hypothetical protein
MRSKVATILVCGLLVAGSVGVSMRTAAIAQEAKKADSEKKAKTSGDRLPPNYGKIGLSEAQRKSIYAIQNKFEAQIEELEKKIAALKSQQAAEIEAVLTDEQKKALAAAVEESKKKAAEKKKAAAKPKESN